MKRWLALFLLLPGITHADFGPQEPTLFPAGFPTAETLRRREWMVPPPPWGWMAYGINDRWTVGWDYPAALFGYPAVMTRIQYVNTERFQSAIEFYYFGVPSSHDDDRQDDFRVIHRKGYQAWVHLNQSATLAENWRVHFYGGANYKHQQEYVPRGSATFAPKIYRRHVNPDAGIDLEWRIRPWVRMHVNWSYGNTFYFVDQVAIKSLYVWAFSFAPWTSHRWALVRNLRFELNALWVRVPDAHYKKSLPIPIYPVVYWQWGGNR